MDKSYDKRQLILIIDDTPIHTHVLTNMLSPYYAVKVATNGQKGIELAQKYKIDLILLDIVMENLSGFEVLSELKKIEKTKDIRVIFITSMDSKEDEMRGLALGAVDYITKPFVDEIVMLRVNLHMQLIAQMRTIEKLSYFDSTTNVRNRRSFCMLMSEIWARSAQAGGCISLIMVDIDGFKAINDSYGHVYGDFCLRTVAEIIQSTVVNGENLVFRWSGDSFVIMLPGIRTEEAEEIAETIKQSIADAVVQEVQDTHGIKQENPQTKLTVSIGVGTIFPNDENNDDDLYRAVNDALLKAKNMGRDRVEVAVM